MIELFKATKLNDYKELNKELINLTIEKKALQFLHYQYDYPWIIENLGDIKGKKILDAGCGAGVLQFYLEKHGAEVHSCDVNDYHRFFKIRNSSIKFKQCSFSDAPFFFPYEENTFDAIVCVSVIEHLYPEHIRNSIKNFANVLKPGGVLLITTGVAEDRMYTDKCYVFNEPDVKEMLIRDGLKLYNDFNNFKDIENLFTSMCHTVSSNRLMPLFFMPAGIKLIKKK